MISRTSSATKKKKLMRCSAGEALSEDGILCGDSDWASVQMTLAHHYASQRDQWRGEAKLFGSKQRGDHHVAAGFQLAVGLYDDAATQVVQHELCCVSARPSSQGMPRMFDRGHGEAPVPPS